MKIVCVNGSPRKNSNSAGIAQHFCETAQKKGAELKTYFINKLDYKGCQGCNACKEKSEKCVLQDGLTEVLEEIRSCDLLLMASPVYYGDVSSQMKAFIDRNYSFVDKDFTPRLASGKKTLFVLSQANPDEKAFADIYSRYSSFYKMMGFTDCGVIRACGVRGPGEVAGREDIMKLTEEKVLQIFA